MFKMLGNFPLNDLGILKIGLLSFKKVVRLVALELEFMYGTFSPWVPEKSIIFVNP